MQAVAKSCGNTVFLLLIRCGDEAIRAWGEESCALQGIVCFWRKTRAEAVLKHVNNNNDVLVVRLRKLSNALPVPDNQLGEPSALPGHARIRKESAQRQTVGGGGDSEGRRLLS